MPTLFDPSTDFEDVVDGLEPVTILRRGDGTTVVTNALRRAMGRGAGRLGTGEAEPSDGKYTSFDTRWHFPTVEADRPHLGDVILDGDSNRHTVLEAREDTFSKRWRCVTRDLAIFHGLNATIVIEKASHAKGTHEAHEASWSVWKAGVRARIQPGADSVMVEHGAQVTKRTVQVFVEDDPGIEANYRIKTPDSTYYRIENYTGSERIGELATISAEEELWQS